MDLLVDTQERRAYVFRTVANESLITIDPDMLALVKLQTIRPNPIENSAQEISNRGFLSSKPSYHVDARKHDRLSG